MTIRRKSSRSNGLAALAVEVAQLALPYRERMPGAGADALERHVRRQFRGHFPLRRPAVERAVEDALGAEVFHAVDAEVELLHPRAVEQLLGQESLGPESHGAAVALDQVHRRGAEEGRDELVGRMLVD